MATKTAAPATSPLRLNRLEIEDFLRITAMRIDAEGRHIVITGPNASGKTTAVDAIWAALGGKSSKDMPEPIRRGSKQARVKVDLGEYIVERVYEEGGSRLIVTAADGSTIKHSRKLLDGFLGQYTLDPVAFIGRRPQDQIDDVLAICGVTPPVDQVREITGQDHPVIASESANSYLMRLSADQTGVYYDRRRELHRALDQKRKALDEQAQELAGAGGPLTADERQAASPAALVGRMQELSKQADSRRGAIGGVEDCRRNLEDANTRLGAIEAERRRELEAVAELERQLVQRRANVAHLEERIGKGLAVIGELDQELATAETAAAAITDPAPEICTLKDKLGRMETEEEERSKRKHLAGDVDRLAQEVERAELEHQAVEGVLERLRNLRAHLLDGIELGIQGLEIGAGELRLGGVPFQQASQAEQIRTACGIAMKQAPRLRILCVDDGEHLDRESRKLLFQIADQQDFQVIFTAVADTEKLKVEIVDA